MFATPQQKKNKNAVIYRCGPFFVAPKFVHIQ